MQILILALTIILFTLWHKVFQDKRKQSHIFISAFAVMLFVFHLFSLYINHAIDGSFNLLLIDIDTNLDAPSTWLFPVGYSLVLIFTRWLMVLSVTWAIIGSFYHQKTIHVLIGVLGGISFLLHVILLPDLLTAYLGLEWSYFNLRTIMYVLEIVVLGTLSVIFLWKMFSQKVRLHWKRIRTLLLVIIVSSLAVMPQSILYNVFGLYGEVPDEFVTSHLVVIMIPFIMMMVSYLALKNKEQEVKDLFIKFLVIAAFFQYFYLPRTGLGALPLHLCNAAIILMMYSVLFKKEGVFYFSYFANVVGALSAILLPNYSTDLNMIQTIHFGYNHLYAFVIPILAVALKTFPRPNLRHMYQAIGVFTVYYVAVVILNAWFNNYQSGVDYFFTYSDFLTDMFGVRQLQFDYIVELEVGDLVLRFFYVFQILYYLGFIFLMFMSWYIYDAFFQMFDRHYALQEKKKAMQLDMLQLKKLMNGKSLKEPVNPGGLKMIKITNFSKKYGKSNKKAVDNFSLEVHKGEVFGFLGHNGAGKSTTIKSLVGIQSITEGEMEICGYSIKTQPLEAKLKIGYVSDNHAVYEKLTGREYISYVADLYNVSAIDKEERLNKYMVQFNLAHAIDQEVKSYSHGMKQKLVVIASLIHQPEVWILDEPLTGLDPTSAYQIKESMKEHAQKGNIVFFSSHVIEVVEKICDRIAIINNGRLQGIYEMDDLRRDKVSLEELYMRNVNLADQTE